MRKPFFPLSSQKSMRRDDVISSLKRISAALIKKNRRITKIYLFGSFAEAKDGVYSDADILVVLKHDTRRMLDRIPEFILKFSEAPVPVDVLVYTQQELQKMTEEKSPFILRIVRKGMLMGAG